MPGEAVFHAADLTRNCRVGEVEVALDVGAAVMEIGDLARPEARIREQAFVELDTGVEFASVSGGLGDGATVNNCPSDTVRPGARVTARQP